MDITLHLRLVGLLMFGIVLLNFAVWKRYQWKHEIQRLTVLTRQVFVVHSFYIMLTIAAFGALSLIQPSALTEPSTLAPLVLGFLCLFWFTRLIAQLFYYDASLWRGQRLNTFVHITFTGVWAYFTTVYGWALALQLAPAT